MLWLFDWLLYLIGIFQVLHLFDFLINSLKTIASKADLSVYGRGSWALVTACTDGIGRGFVRELAKEGFNIILVSRTGWKLKEEASFLEKNFGVETLTVTKDFSESHKKPIEFFEDLYNQVKSKDISIVVNNVGGANINYFKDASFKELEHFNSMNLWPIAFISRLIIPDLLKRKNRAAIINLSSVIHDSYNPKNSIYNAGKTFDHKLSLIMKLDLDQVQMNSQNIDVLCLMPGMVKTPLTEDIKAEVLQINPEECARAGLNCLGKVDMTYGHWKHVLSRVVFHAMSPLIPIFSLKTQITKSRPV